MLESCLSQSFLTTTDKIARQMSSQPSIEDQCYNWNFLGTVIVDEKRYLIPLSVLQARRSSVASSNKWTIVRDVKINKSNSLLNMFFSNITFWKLKFQRWHYYVKSDMNSHGFLFDARKGAQIKKCSYTPTTDYIV